MVTVQKGCEFGQRDVLLRLHRTHHHAPERFDAMRPQIPTFGLRGRGSGGPEHSDPPDRGSDTDAEPLGRGATCCSSFDCRDHTATQIF
jgi:hypothetical protein